MPCYDPWDAWLTPGTDEYAAAKRRVEALSDSARHTIDAYLQMHHVEPLSQPRQIPFAPVDVPLRPFELSKLSLGLIHSLAQHCLCDAIGPVELMDAASVMDEAREPDATYRVIVLDISSAIRRGLCLGRYDRRAYERHEWLFWGAP